MSVCVWERMLGSQKWCMYNRSTVVLKSVETHSLVAVPKRSSYPSVMRKQKFAKCCSLGFHFIQKVVRREYLNSARL